MQLFVDVFCICTPVYLSYTQYLINNIIVVSTVKWVEYRKHMPLSTFDCHFKPLTSHFIFKYEFWSECKQLSILIGCSLFYLYWVHIVKWIAYDNIYFIIIPTYINQLNQIKCVTWLEIISIDLEYKKKLFGELIIKQI